MPAGCSSALASPWPGPLGSRERCRPAVPFGLAVSTENQLGLVADLAVTRLPWSSRALLDKGHSTVTFSFPSPEQSNLFQPFCFILLGERYFSFFTPIIWNCLAHLEASAFTGSFSCIQQSLPPHLHTGRCSTNGSYCSGLVVSQGPQCPRCCYVPGGA